MGGRIAAAAGYQYSPALRQLDGQWTEDRLDAFLKDPAAFAPGTKMIGGQVADDAERRALIEFLKSYR